MHVVWFKRDLRGQDHAALFEAAAGGSKVLALYILEPKLWNERDMSLRHYLFLQECIEELSDDLKQLGQSLIIRVGEAVDVLEALHKEYGIDKIFSHQETWNGWTYSRDKAVKKWCKHNHILWNEYAQNGVIRALKNRDGWSKKWYEFMSNGCVPVPKKINFVNIQSDPLPTPTELSLRDVGALDLQRGGRKRALDTLKSFLNERARGYSKRMSSPVTAFESCSRLSPYLAFGVISMREVFQALELRKKKELKALDPKEKKGWPMAMTAFAGRLRWHCHFIQKLEDEPDLEFRNIHSAYDVFRQEPLNEEYFNAWKDGYTGYPMVDACMRALKKLGGLTFECERCW